MTEKEMEKIATIIAAKVLNGLIEQQKEWDQQFTNDLNSMSTDGFGNAKLVNEEELILAEIARLMTLLSSYEDKEEYEKAAIIHNKLKILENRLNRL